MLRRYVNSGREEQMHYLWGHPIIGIMRPSAHFAVTVRPPNTIQGSIATKLRLCVRDLNNPLPQLAAAKKLLNDSVANVQPSLGESGASLSSIKAGCYNLQVSSKCACGQEFSFLHLLLIQHGPNHFDLWYNLHCEWIDGRLLHLIVCCSS